MTKQTCETCRFHGRDGFNLCQRRAPVISPEIMCEESAHVGVWPETDPGDWCGEWEGKGHE